MPSPAVLMLHQPVPNPSRELLQLRYEMPERGRAKFEIVSVMGGVVLSLMDAVCGPGLGVATVDSHALAAGIYFVRLEAAGRTMTRRIVLVK